MSKNCPFCPPDSQYEAWGYSPEGWSAAKSNHDSGHPNQARVNPPQVVIHVSTDDVMKQVMYPYDNLVDWALSRHT